MRDFLASITQEEWTSLDLEPVAANLDSADELALLSYEVVRKSHAEHQRSVEELVIVMTSVLSGALARIAYLANPRNARSA